MIYIERKPTESTLIFALLIHLILIIIFIFIIIIIIMPL